MVRKTIIPFVFAMLAMGGCRTYHKAAVASRADFLGGTGLAAEERAESLYKSSKTMKLGAFEKGRMKMLKGDFEGSSKDFAPILEDLFDETAEGPVFRTSSIAGTALAATVGDDFSIPYDPPAFETVMALQYEALNSLCLGKEDNARVYMRRATAIQTQLKDEKAPATEESKDQKNAQSINKATSEINSHLDEVAALVTSPYENAVAWYLAGFLMECDGDASNAAIAYREAARICPGAARFASAPAGDGTDVLVVYEESLIDMMEPIKIPLPLGGTLWSVDFPVYKSPARKPSSVAAEVGGALAARLVPAVNVQALAYRSLKDKIPGIVTRNVTRAAVKVAAQQAANHISTGNSTANLLIRAAVLAFNATKTITDEADTRAWITIPEHVHFARVRVPKTAGRIVLRNAAGGKTLEVEIPSDAGRKCIVWVSDTGRSSTVDAIAIPRSTAHRTVGATIL